MSVKHVGMQPQYYRQVSLVVSMPSSEVLSVKTGAGIKGDTEQVQAISNCTLHVRGMEGLHK